MQAIKQKSGILVWSEENINNAPSSPGLFILRSSPINGAIIYMEISDNLKNDLSKIFYDKNFPETKFFDWYETDNKNEAEIIKKDWQIKQDS